MKIDVTQTVCDLKGVPIPVGGMSGQIARIIGMAVTIPGDEHNKETSTVQDLIEIVCQFMKPGEEVSADDKRKGYKLAKRAERATPLFELEIEEAEWIQKRSVFLPTVEFGFLDDVIEDARAEAHLAEKAAADAAAAKAATADDNGPADEAT